MDYRTLTCVPVLCALLFIAVAGPAEADPLSPHIRPLTPRLAALLGRARAVSATVASLANALERSDLIVHLEHVRCSAPGLIGETRLVTRAGGRRYVRIALDPGLSDDATIALLAHELQHAREIADAPWVVDHATMERLFVAIGHTTSRERMRMRVDTAAGPATARQVAAELRASRRADALAGQRD